MEIVVYNTLDHQEMFDLFVENLRDQALCYTTFDLLRFGLKDGQEIQTAIHRAIQVCETGGLIFEENFKLIYVGGDEGIIPVWELSETAFRLSLLNADTQNPTIAHMQLELLGVH